MNTNKQAKDARIFFEGASAASATVNNYGGNATITAPKSIFNPDIFKLPAGAQTAKAEPVKVGICVAYDWQLLAFSIPQVYAFADTILLSVDAQRTSWAGNPFSWDEEGFRALVKRLDPLGKIVVAEGDYHFAHLSPIENEVLQRNSIAAQVGEGGWHVQIDADEFFLNFEGFVRRLRRFSSGRKVNICCPWITLFKQDAEGFYYVRPQKSRQVEFTAVATRHPKYEYGRRNGYFNKYAPYAILHLSWARSEQEVWEKLNNWGHKNDFDIAAYFAFWKQLNFDNKHTYRNFHQVHPDIWPALEFVPAKSIEDLMQRPAKQWPLPLNAVQLSLKNSIWISRFKKLLRIR